MDEQKKELLRETGFSKEVERVEAGNCPLCEQPVKQADFRDELSRREFAISGMCMSCQDKMFAEPEE